MPETTANALLGAYEEAVVALFHEQASALLPRLLETIRRRELGWAALIMPY